MAVVVSRKDAKHILEMIAIENEQPVETLRPHRADETLGHAVGLRRAKRCTHDLDSLPAKHLIKRGREFLVPIANQKPTPAAAAPPTSMLCLLDHPWGARIGRASGEMYAATAQFDEEEHVQP